MKPSENLGKPANQQKKLEQKSSPVPTWIMFMIFGILLVWGLLLACGSLLFAEVWDVRKPLVVMATMVVFLGVWWVALKLKRD